MASTPAAHSVVQESTQGPSTQRKLEKLNSKEFIEMMGLIDDPKVDIFVGPEAKGYSLSKRMLCQSSAFFAAAFEGNFKEGVTQTLTLEEDDVDAFELLIQYIYTRDLVPNKDPTNFTDIITRCLDLAKISDKLGMCDVVNVAYDKIAAIASGNYQRIQRCHLDMVFAEDWPPITVYGKQRAFEAEFALYVFEIFLRKAVGRQKYADWPLEETLAELPDLALRVSDITFVRIQDRAMLVGTKGIFHVLNPDGKEEKSISDLGSPS